MGIHKLKSPIKATKVSEISGVEKKKMNELKKDETIVSPRYYLTLAEK